jgi:gliding motility-associated-like protein
MKKFYLLVVLCSIFVAQRGYASHIVGGQLYYDKLAGNNYRVTLKLYRDCFCTNCAAFGDPEYVSIFDAGGNLVTQLGMQFPGSNELVPPINNSCMVQPSVCIEEAVYTGVVSLPPIAGGYDIVYQRCCRNAGTSNIVTPDNNGATYVAHVPEPGALFVNSSPRFPSFPPLYICVEAPLVFDHSATDPDGDVLVYSLCDPLVGGDPTCPNPSPANTQAGCPNEPPPPPYGTIPWSFPYSATNPLNSPSNGGNLQIDPQTGILTGVPNQQGQYAVGVCVEEYRNGVLIGKTFRDFQFNVTTCNIPIANIPSFGINPITGIGIFAINCQSLTVTLNNNTYNPPPANVPLALHWDFGVASLTNDTSNLSSPTYTFPDTGTYLVTLIATKDDGVGCADTTRAFVRVYPTFNTDFSVPDVCKDSAAIFIDLTASTASTVSQWNWLFGDGGTSSLQNPTHSYLNPGTYNVRLISQSAIGCKDTMQKQVTIHPLPIANFSATNPCVFEPVQFTNTTSGAVTAYSWAFGVPGATSTVAAPTYTYNTPGNYNVSLAVVSDKGCRDTVITPITIHPLPSTSVIADTNICPFTSITLSGDVPVASSTYTWSPATGLNDPNILNTVATPAPPATAKYVLHVVSQFGCDYYDSVSVSFFPIPLIDAGIDTSVCLNPGSFRDSVQLTATGGVSYIWTPATGLTSTTIPNPISRPAVNTTYFVTGTDVNGCVLTDSVTVFVLDPALNLIIDTLREICFKDTININVLNQGASVYIWNPTVGLSNPSIYNPDFFPSVTSLYILTVQNYCYSKSDSVTVIVHPLPVLSLNPLDSICNGESYQLNAAGASTYTWDPEPSLSATNIPDPIATPTVTTQYIVTGVDSNGCTNKDTTLLLVFYPPNITIGPDTDYVCQLTPVQLWATGGFTYSWSPTATLNNPNIADPIALPVDTTTYYVTVTNVHGCVNNDSVTINVQLPVTAIAPSPYDACEGKTVQLFAEGGFYYLWFPSTGLNSTVISNPFAVVDTNIFYSVKVSNDCFSDTAVVEVIAHPLPLVDAGNDTLIYRDTQAQLNGSTPETNYFWNPSDWLSDPYSLYTIAYPPATQWYELFAINQWGCLNKDSVLVLVEGKLVIELPTGFSPNGDGMNDVFHIIRFLNIDKLNAFVVYNRWGNVVFSTTDITQGWDGTVNAVNQPIGTYIWMVDAVSKDGEQILRKGNITLVR